MTTKRVTVAEFRQNLKEYLDQIESGEVVEVRGIPLCMYIKPQEVEENVHKKPTRQELQDKIDAIIGKKPMYIEPEQEQTFQHDPCDLCTQRTQLYRFYDDGERKVCAPCMKNKLGKEAARHLTEANKIYPQEPAKRIEVTLHNRSDKITREPVRYCTACKFQAASAGSNLCVKCNKKKK